MRRHNGLSITEKESDKGFQRVGMVVIDVGGETTSPKMITDVGTGHHNV